MLSRPIIGYAGVINEKLDLDLLRVVAQSHHEWQFVFIGPDAMRYEREQLDVLRSLPNVHFLGSKPVADLPAYVRACDVCLIPYKQNEWTRHISPLKLYEYLAAGVPIVATPIPATVEMAETLWLASTPEAFGHAIAAGLAADSPHRRQRQQALAQNNTWERRLEDISAAIATRLAETEG